MSEQSFEEINDDRERELRYIRAVTSLVRFCEMDSEMVNIGDLLPLGNNLKVLFQHDATRTSHDIRYGSKTVHTATDEKFQRTSQGNRFSLDARGDYVFAIMLETRKRVDYSLCEVILPTIELEKRDIPDEGQTPLKPAFHGIDGRKLSARGRRQHYFFFLDEEVDPDTLRAFSSLTAELIRPLLPSTTPNNIDSTP